MEKEAIRQQLEKVMIENNFSGVVSIRKDKKVLFEAARGQRDRSNKLNNQIDTIFGIASGTKLFTALAIGRLIESNQLKLEDRVFDIIDYPFESYDKTITLQQLLTHSSGLPDYFDEELIEDFDNFQVDIPWYNIREPKDYFPIFPKRPMNKLPANTAVGYITEGSGWRTNVYNLPVVGGGDGGIFTTIPDLYKLWDGIFSGRVISKGLLEKFVDKHIITKADSDSYYGHGIWIYDADGIPREEYIMGADAGISFKSAIVREKDLIYTVISNTGEGAWPILKAIVGLGLDG
jgi:CubicO group peptidase (beta-lactamase class C family)